MTIESDINKFCSHLEKQIGEIRDLDSALFKKILIVSILDTLAHVSAPKTGTKTRFLSFIERFVDWDKKIALASLSFPVFWKLNLNPA